MDVKSCAKHYNGRSLLPRNVAKPHWVAGKLVTANTTPLAVNRGRRHEEGLGFASWEAKDERWCRRSGEPYRRGRSWFAGRAQRARQSTTHMLAGTGAVGQKDQQGYVWTSQRQRDRWELRVRREQHQTGSMMGRSYDGHRAANEVA
jgi:hypothetical protein